MKILYLECNMGVAGDMLLAALLELIPNPDAFIDQMNHWGLPGVTITQEKTQKSGITGTQVSVRIHGHEEMSQDMCHDASRNDLSHVHTSHDHNHDHHDSHAHSHHTHSHPPDKPDHHHASFAHIENIIQALPVSAWVKENALAVYTLLAQAEAHAHGKPVDTVHFHEVGMMDAVADITGVCALIERLSPNQIIASPIHVGSGQVRCAHGILPVPAPATAHLLRGVPSSGGAIQGELCTPTGAALIKHFAQSFGPQPLMSTSAVGYGMGKKDFPAANCVRAFLGHSVGSTGDDHDDIVELTCNLDDMTGEAIAFATETLLEAGALDALLLPAQMKKNRPGHLLVCLCRPADEEKMAQIILRHTSTFGLRVHTCRRYVLQRATTTTQTAYGAVRVKTGTGHGAEKSKPEHDDLATLAKANSLTLSDILDSLS